MDTHYINAVEVEYVGKIILSHAVLKESSKESWSSVMSEWRYSHRDNGLYIRSYADIAPTQATKM